MTKKKSLRGFCIAIEKKVPGWKCWKIVTQFDSCENISHYKYSYEICFRPYDFWVKNKVCHWRYLGYFSYSSISIALLLQVSVFFKAIKNRPNALHKYFGTDYIGTKSDLLMAMLPWTKLADILLITGPRFLTSILSYLDSIYKVNLTNSSQCLDLQICKRGSYKFDITSLHMLFIVHFTVH